MIHDECITKSFKKKWPKNQPCFPSRVTVTCIAMQKINGHILERSELSSVTSDHGNVTRWCKNIEQAITIICWIREHSVSILRGKVVWFLFTVQKVVSSNPCCNFQFFILLFIHCKIIDTQVLLNIINIFYSSKFPYFDIGW